jgi:hypothetical protein
MIRRSTLVFLTCLTALGPPTLRAKSVAAVNAQPPTAEHLLARSSPTTSTMLLAQASGSTGNELDVNSRGEPVKRLQVRLQQAGYYDGPVDGLYGLDTQRAVQAFQSSVDLEQTGSLSDETWQKLESLTNEKASSAATAGTATAETAPTASELPAAGGSNADTAEVTAASGGLGKVFGLSLGLAAVLASFGIGFFMANRGKAAKPDEDDWSEVESNVGGNFALPSSPSTTVPFAETSVVEPFSSAGGYRNGQGTGRSASGSANGTTNSNGGNGNGSSMRQSGAIAPMSQGTRTNAQNGQIAGHAGATSPLAQTDIIEGLIGDLRNPDPTRRRKAIWELGQRGNSLAMQPLVDSMVDADSKEKSLVLAALSEIGIRSLKPMSRALAIALQDENPEVRKNAIRDLTRVYDLVVQISQMLGHATEDEDAEVRQTATWALDQLNRIRRSQELDANVRTFSSGNAAPPIDLLSSEASLRRSQQGL